MVTAQTSYRAWLKQDFDILTDAMEISDLQKHFLRSRWLGQLLWMEGKAASAQTWHYILRLTAIIGGVIVPALVSQRLDSGAIAQSINILTVVISLLVAISVALEEFFHFGERWRHYRRSAELLKIEGWQFFQLGGPYQQYPSHAEAYAAFAGRVEEHARHEVDVYITQVIREREDKRAAKREGR